MGEGGEGKKEAEGARGGFKCGEEDGEEGEEREKDEENKLGGEE